MTPELPLADELAAVFARMSGLLLSTSTVRSALELVTSLAKETFPDTAGAGVSLLDENGERISAAATDSVVEELDAAQYELGQGPCLTAWEERVVVRIEDLSLDDCWPAWSRAAVRRNTRAVLSAPMVVGHESLGALKVYSPTPGAYGTREEYLLTMFAAQAAVLLANVTAYEKAQRVSDDLRDAMRGRDLVNVAKGVIMQREHVTEDTAFILLADEARHSGKSLRQVALDTTHTTTRQGR